MIHTSSLLPLFYIFDKYNLPPDISRLIYTLYINRSAQIIIDKWYSYVNIHNINLCYIVNKIPLLNRNNMTYYNINDINLKNTLSICLKYIRPNISCKQWWLNFIQNCYNGFLYIDNLLDDVVIYNNNLLQQLSFKWDL